MTIADIVSKIYKDTRTNSTSYPAADMLIDINEAYNDVVAQILDADGRWQWDDDNNTDESIATTALVAAQQDYSISTAHLKILRVELKGNGGTFFQKLLPKDQADEPLLGLDNITQGTPIYYDVVGRSIFLYPIPSYSQSASLKVYFQRGPAEFTSGEVSTGTKVPGFSSLFHSLIPNLVTYNYWMTNNPPMADRFAQKIAAKTAALKSSYGSRDDDDPAQLTMRSIQFR